MWDFICECCKTMGFALCECCKTMGFALWECCKTMVFALRAIVVGVVFAPLLAIYSFGKGVWCFGKNLYVDKNWNDYFWQGLPKSGDVDYRTRLREMSDKDAKTMSGTVVLGRLGAIALMTVCILGFIGAVAAPLPGVTPLYTASVIGVAKMLGITAGYTILGRTAGSILGGVLDLCKVCSNPVIKSVNQENSAKPQRANDNNPSKKVSSTSLCFKVFKAVGLHSFFGDEGFVFGRHCKAQLKACAKKEQKASPILSSSPSSSSSFSAPTPTPPPSSLLPSTRKMTINDSFARSSRR